MAVVVSPHRFMGTIHQVGPQTDSGETRQVVYVKGAPDRCVLGSSTHEVSHHIPSMVACVLALNVVMLQGQTVLTKCHTMLTKWLQ